jgi:hypothetical protein
MSKKMPSSLFGAIERHRKLLSRLSNLDLEYRLHELKRTEMKRPVVSLQIKRAKIV